ncbi:hypothetical protein HPB48_012158 [Haemaphysalis longicornis]|uniref:Uncharacterized protein n=1 Tax=Haemaphysalis longicornis TaxID=44386 RepID=A0A9J6FC87_HAELO|nr:hypothetical protein HPB48_012158 [Haemaphysalis longicornis]
MYAAPPLAIDPEDEEPHKCVPHCINCDGDHAPTDPKCPSRLQADEDLAESMQARQQRAARLCQRPNKYPPPPPLDDANYRHLQNRFSALRKSTSQDRSQSARRSSSRGVSKECSAPLEQHQKTPNKEREESVTRPTPAKRRLLASKTRSDSSTRVRDPRLPAHHTHHSHTPSYREIITQTEMNPMTTATTQPPAGTAVPATNLAPPTSPHMNLEDIIRQQQQEIKNLRTNYQAQIDSLQSTIVALTAQMNCMEQLLTSLTTKRLSPDEMPPATKVLVQSSSTPETNDTDYDL